MGRLKRFLSPAVADAVMSSGDEQAARQPPGADRHPVLRHPRLYRLLRERRARGGDRGAAGLSRGDGRADPAARAGVDHRTGDGIMVIFNDPLPCDDPAGSALDLALAMRERMAELCAGWRRLGHRLGFGIGISLGYATVGMVGSEGRYDYTASGTAVNLAARLCDRGRGRRDPAEPARLRRGRGPRRGRAGGRMSSRGSRRRSRL